MITKGFFILTYYVIQNKWTHCALSIIIIHFFHFLCLLALTTKVGPLMSSAAESLTQHVVSSIPLQCVVTSSSSFSCILSAGVRNYSPVYLLQEMTVKADRAELCHQSNAVVQTIQCPLCCAHFGNFGRHQGLALRGSGSKSERTGSQTLAVIGVFLFCAHQLILFLFNPCPFRFKVLCITVSHY